MQTAMCLWSNSDYRVIDDLITASLGKDFENCQTINMLLEVINRPKIIIDLAFMSLWNPTIKYYQEVMS